MRELLYLLSMPHCIHLQLKWKKCLILFLFAGCMRLSSLILHSFFTSLQCQQSILILLGANICSSLNSYCCFIKKYLRMMQILSGSMKLRRKSIVHLVLMATPSHMVKGLGLLYYMLRVSETNVNLLLFIVVYCVILCLLLSTGIFVKMLCTQKMHLCHCDSASCYISLEVWHYLKKKYAQAIHARVNNME